LRADHALREFEKAEAYWEKSFALDDDMLDSRYSLAFCLKDQGKLLN